MMKRCLYCYEFKDESEFSKEHVIPKSIGGNFNISLSPFLLYNVCGRCNNILGIYVDAPFTKSLIINMFRSTVANKWIRPENNTIAPLSYMGVNKDIKYNNNICEVYLSPSGDSIYHFHEPYPHEDEMTGVVGVPPTVKNKKFDNGFVFILMRTNNPVWWPTVLLSIIDSFKNSILYMGNAPVPKINKGNFAEIPNELKSLQEQLFNIPSNIHNQRMTHSIDSEQRFNAKLGLSIGASFLNNDFIDSEDANILRSFMREMDKEKRKKIPVKGSGILGGNWAQVKKYLSWEYGHILLLNIIDDKLSLYMNYYGELSTIIQISENRSHWEGKIDSEGILYVLVPEKQKFVGPMTLYEFLLHKQREKLNNELDELENEIINYSAPPFNIDEGGIT